MSDDDGTGASSSHSELSSDDENSMSIARENTEKLIAMSEDDDTGSPSQTDASSDDDSTMSIEKEQTERERSPQLHPVEPSMQTKTDEPSVGIRVESHSDKETPVSKPPSTSIEIDPVRSGKDEKMTELVQPPQDKDKKMQEQMQTAQESATTFPRPALLEVDSSSSLSQMGSYFDISEMQESSTWINYFPVPSGTAPKEPRLGLMKTLIMNIFQKMRMKDQRMRICLKMINRSRKKNKSLRQKVLNESPRINQAPIKWI